ncbi:MAG: hypothetical protein WCR98_04815 [Saccharofermentanales bacterium]
MNTEKVTTRTIINELTWAREQILKSALEASIGTALSSLAVHAGYFEVHIDGTERFILNGRPLLKLGPVKLESTTGEDGKTTMRITREYEALVKE